MRIYLWLGTHNEGIQSYGILKGENFKDAIRIELETSDSAIYWDKENFDKELSTEEIVDEIDFYIETSEVDGDSSEQIVVFDITDPNNVIMIHPLK